MAGAAAAAAAHRVTAAAAASGGRRWWSRRCCWRDWNKVCAGPPGAAQPVKKRGARASRRPYPWQRATSTATCALLWACVYLFGGLGGRCRGGARVRARPLKQKRGRLQRPAAVTWARPSRMPRGKAAAAGGGSKGRVWAAARQSHLTHTNTHASSSAAAWRACAILFFTGRSRGRGARGRRARSAPRSPCRPTPGAACGTPAAARRARATAPGRGARARGARPSPCPRPGS